MKVYFYNLPKRVNSTKRPTGSGQVFDCVLKENTSIISPTLQITVDTMENVPGWNYAYIPDFARYYHVVDVSSDGWMWYFSLSIDVLATYRTEIGDANLYMLRSTASWNGKVIDNFYPMLAEYTTNIIRTETEYPHWDLETPGVPNWQIRVTSGAFILGVLAVPESSGAGSYGSVKYMALSASAMRSLISYLMGNSIWNNTNFDIEGATLSVTKAIINPLSYIKSCHWAPVAYSDIQGTSVNSVTIWDWSVPVSSGECKLLTSYPTKYARHVINIDAHPQASRGSYLNSSPYTNYTLVYPPYGMIPIDSVDVLQTASLWIEHTIDLITGGGRLDIYTTSSGSRDKLINRIKSQVCVPVQLSEVGYDYSNMAASLIGGAAEGLGNWLSGFSSAASSGLAGAVSQVGNLANATRQRVSTLGSAGNFCDLDGTLDLIQDFFTIANEDFDHVGRPLCAIRKANTGSAGSYWLAREGDLELGSATFAEREEVKTFLENGFFWE